VVKYRFNIKTRNGQKVDNILIQARDQIEAERRLRQMYVYCEVLDCNAKETEVRSDMMNVDGIISIITK
jgi:hypothetical protein